ncbi:hypothetical protein GPJ81_04595 [Pseudomonas alkylphenolica]|uniref:Uncharacterized protein n=1 Tax=Pseudomonas alkylphenolica TaxID=237609 RepID=A0A6I6H6G1_9PSED|nr:hypothetical protein [Pseudomonas alkylphenolica]QGW75978.1 hypothetical protein GPJ81_04595 [Pseudomonas alkylphenolica]
MGQFHLSPFLYTILLNLGQLAFVAAMLLGKGMPSVDDGDFWIFLLLTVVPVASIMALIRGRYREGAPKSLLALYLARRRLEEQRRIDELSS